MGKARIIRSNSVLKGDTPTKGLRTAIHCRFSDPSMMKKHRKVSKVDTGGEIAKSVELQKANMKRACNKLEIEWNEAYVIGDKKHQHTTRKFIKDVRDREDYQVLEQWISNKEIDAVMDAYVDRVGRTSADNREFIELYRKHGIRYFVCEVEYDLYDDNANFKLGIELEFADYGNSSMRKRAYEVRLEEAHNGIYHYGRPPYPYMKNPDYNGSNDYYIPNPEMIPLFREIRALYMENNGNNRNTTDRLSLQYGMSLKTINSILFSETFHTGKRKVKLDHDEPVAEYKSVDEEVEVGEIKKIATEEEYKELIRVRDSRKGGNRSSIKNDYQLSRKIRCGHCGQWMSGHQKRSGELGFLCFTDDYNGRKKLGSRRNNGCNMWVPLNPLREGFFNELQYVFENPEKLETALGEQGQRYQEIQNTLKILKARQVEIDKTYEGIQYGISNAKGNKKIIDRLIANSEKLADEEQKIETQLKELTSEEKQLRSIAHLNPRLPAITNHIKQVGGFSGYTDKEKKKLLDYIFPPAHPANRKYGITVTKTGKNSYSFQVDCVLSSPLFGDFWQVDDKKWEIEGDYNGTSNFTFA